MSTPLAAAIEKARGKLSLSRAEYARRIGITKQGLDKILSGKGVRGDTLARLQRLGGVKVTQSLLASLDKAA